MLIRSWCEKAWAIVADFVLKAAVLGLSLVISLAAVTMPASSSSEATDPVQPSASANNGNETQTQAGASYQQASAKLNRLYAALDVVNKKIDRSLFDIDALSARLGSNPMVIFHFVRDNIRYEPYTGVLRGALGTLLCRAGNSLDRSLLLAALLQKAGFTVRIASGELATQQAQVLVNRLFEPAKPAPSALPSLDALAPELSRATGIDEAKFLQAAEKAENDGERQKKVLISYVDAETHVLSNLLTKAGVDAGIVTSNQQLLAEAKEHYWTQYQNSSGQWEDLDSSFADAKPGKAVATTANTFATDSVPEELYHHLKITLTLRVAQVADGRDGPTTDTVLLDQELRVADQQGKDITVANVPQPMPNFLKLAANSSDSLAGVKGYQTVLQIGTQVTAGKYFDLNGKISNRLPGPEGQAVSNAGGLGGAFGALGGGAASILGGSSSSQGPASRIVGEWADYKLTSPAPNGGQPVVHTYHRDIVAPAVVQSWSVTNARSPRVVRTKLTKNTLQRGLAWSVELLPFAGTATPNYLGQLLISSFLARRGLLEHSLRSAYGMSAKDALRKLTPEPPLGVLSLAVSALNVIEDGAADTPLGLRIYFSSPGLIAYEVGGLDPSSALNATSTPSPLLIRRYDVASFAPRIVERMEASTNDHNRATHMHLLLGVSVTRLEWALLAESAGNPASVRNTTQVFAAAQRNGLQQLVLSPGKGLRSLAAARLPDSVKAEISSSLASGYTVAVPAGAVDIGGELQVGWWRLDTRSGELIGVMSGGRGQAIVEDGVLEVEEETPDLLVFAEEAKNETKCLVKYNGSNKNTEAFEDLFKCSTVAAIGGVGGLIGGTFEKVTKVLEGLSELSD